MPCMAQPAITSMPFSTGPHEPGPTAEALPNISPSQSIEQRQRLWDWLKRRKRDDMPSPSRRTPTPVNKTDDLKDTTPLSTTTTTTNTTAATTTTDTSTQCKDRTTSRSPDGRRPSRPVGIGIPRAPTFKRMEEEQRKNLEPVQLQTRPKNPFTRSGQRGRAVSMQPSRQSPKLRRRDTSAPGLGQPTLPSIDSRLWQQPSARGFAADDAAGPLSPPFSPPLLSPPASPPEHVLFDDDRRSERSEDSDAELDEEIRNELRRKWILNLSMHFRDRSPREKFFITYAETPQKWRRVTISLDYRNAEPDSLEAEMSQMSGQREKSARIYESLRDSLDEIQFYETVTNLKLETRDGRLHVHVTEDVNEIIQYPSVQEIGHLSHVHRYRENELHFLEHLSGFVYKVKVDEQVCVKKEVPGPDSIDEFLYEINALANLVDSHNVIRLQGFVLSSDGSTVKGLLIQYAEQGAIVDRIFDARDRDEPLPWSVRESWAKQIVNGLSEIHEAGYVQGDFTLSNLVADAQDTAKIIDINRRGCPIGWEPPELGALIDSGQRISMFIGVKSDLFQLGMALWAIASQDDEPERRPRPLSADDLPAEVPPYFRKIVASCLHTDPKKRRSATSLIGDFPADIQVSGYARAGATVSPQPLPALAVDTPPLSPVDPAQKAIRPKRFHSPDESHSAVAERSEDEANKYIGVSAPRAKRACSGSRSPAGRAPLEELGGSPAIITSASSKYSIVEREPTTDTARTDQRAQDDDPFAYEAIRPALSNYERNELSINNENDDDYENNNDDNEDIFYNNLGGSAAMSPYHNIPNDETEQGEEEIDLELVGPLRPTITQDDRTSSTPKTEEGEVYKVQDAPTRGHGLRVTANLPPAPAPALSHIRGPAEAEDGAVQHIDSGFAEGSYSKMGTGIGGAVKMEKKEGREENEKPAEGEDNGIGNGAEKTTS